MLVNEAGVFQHARRVFDWCSWGNGGKKCYSEALLIQKVDVNDGTLLLAQMVDAVGVVRRSVLAELDAQNVCTVGKQGSIQGWLSLILREAARSGTPFCGVSSTSSGREQHGQFMVHNHTCKVRSASLRQARRALSQAPKVEQKERGLAHLDHTPIWMLLSPCWSFEDGVKTDFRLASSCGMTPPKEQQSLSGLESDDPMFRCR